MHNDEHIYEEINDYNVISTNNANWEEYGGADETIGVSEECHCEGACGCYRGRFPIVENQKLHDLVDHMESSEDDRSQPESYEMESEKSLRSLSFETEPLMPQT